jgi:hypothetical protein
MSSNKRPPIEALVFLGIFTLAVVLEFSALPHIPSDSPWHKLVEHLTITLLAATALGLTYELGLYEHRKRTLKAVLDEFRQEVSAALQAIGTLTPKEVFGLLRDIAQSPRLTPTLFDPPRSAAEYNFVEDSSYFDRLVPVARGEVINILRTWILQESHRNVKFLASDFVGKFRLQELAEELRNRADKKLQNWESVKEEEQDWVLNFLWAASRCERQQYESLAKLLATTPHTYIQEWILFVPRQMPDGEFVAVIDRFLSKNRNVSHSAMKAVVWALAALSKAGHDVCDLFRKHEKLLGNQEMRSEIEAACRGYTLDSNDFLRPYSPIAVASARHSEPPSGGRETAR